MKLSIEENLIKKKTWEAIGNWKEEKKSLITVQIYVAYYTMMNKIWKIFYTILSVGHVKWNYLQYNIESHGIVHSRLS